ncbi:MAG: hypothetical protein ACM3Q0_03000 [Bacteroidota bacterium]
MCRLPSRTPEAVTICLRRHATSARSGPARSDTSKLSQWTTMVLIVQAPFVYEAGYHAGAVIPRREVFLKSQIVWCSAH